MQFRDDSAAFAANWWTILAVDLAMGLGVLAGGVIWGFASSGWGWLLATVGAVYVFFAGGKIAKWRRLRRQAGL
ncbi:MAG: hypothetical protein ACYDH6_12115 [Acidimicrobiales bacterium]